MCTVSRRVWKFFSPCKQSSAAGCSLNFSAKGGNVTIPKAVLEADVEYTFNLTVWKEGMNPEATNQTVRTTELCCFLPCVPIAAFPAWSQGQYQFSSVLWKASEMQGKLNLGHCWGYVGSPVLVIGRDRCRCFPDIFTLRSTFFLSCQVPVVPSCRPGVRLTVQPWCSWPWLRFLGPGVCSNTSALGEHKRSRGQ